jgi:lysozyme
MKIKQILVFFAVIFGVAAIGYIVLQTKRNSFVYPDFGVEVPPNYPLLGIDISHHQGDINFEETAKLNSGRDSIQFVYIKASEGRNFADDKSEQNALGCAENNLKYGFYHFFHGSLSAQQQALFFCEQIKSHSFDLIPVIDVEISGGLQPLVLVDSVLVFMDKVEEILEVRPMIYTYISFYADYFEQSKASNELFWLAAYNQKNPYMQKENVLIWQFTEKATVDGIASKVDLNVAKRTFYNKVVIQRFNL